MDFGKRKVDLSGKVFQLRVLPCSNLSHNQAAAGRKDLLAKARLGEF